MVLKLFSIRSVRIGWLLLLPVGFSLGIATFPTSTISAGDIVAYVTMVKGEISDNYKPGSPIRVGDKIKVSKDDQLIVFHVKTCDTFKASGGVSLKFRRASYQPSKAPEIKLLKTGCARTVRPKGDDSGINYRAIPDLSRVSTAPGFIINGDRSKIRHIELRETENLANKHVLNIPADAPLQSFYLPWPNGVPPLQAGKTYQIVAIGSGKVIEFKPIIQIHNLSNPKSASGSVILEMSESN